MTTNQLTPRLARADAAQRANVRRCSCYVGWRVRGLEYDTGGCLTYDAALAISRRMDEVGGPDEWRRRFKAPRVY